MTVIVVKAGVMTTPPSDSSEACVGGAALWLTGSLQVFEGNYHYYLQYLLHIRTIVFYSLTVYVNL